MKIRNPKFDVKYGNRYATLMEVDTLVVVRSSRRWIRYNIIRKGAVAGTGWLAGMLYFRLITPEEYLHNKRETRESWRDRLLCMLLRIQLQ